MAETFAQGATPVGVLRSILDNYPYSVGLLREMLQNSDDAGATTQTFVLDRRNHSTESLSDTLARAQGPAFLAHNNAKFNEANWHSIQAVYESSKGSDSSKIGKYGVGFRSVFHITDCPQIVSGDTFAMFDPLKSFTGSVGTKTALPAVSSAQLAPFAWFMDQEVDAFDGTIIRCPLRRAHSQISKNVVAPDSLAQLFKDFIANEAKIALLFLQNINKINIYDISLEGVSTCILQLSVSRSVPIPLGDNNITSTATVTVEGGETSTWCVLLVKHGQDDAVKALPGKNSEDFLKENKLLPHVGIAAPMDGKKCTGRLFTFLPLPLPTGFPVHIHAYFALTQSRQNLRNSQETGLIEGTDDHLLIEWNKLLFERYIPDAWKVFLEIVAKEAGGSSNIFEMWPPQQQTGVASGENVYWKSLPTNLFHSVTSSSSAVWPVFRNDLESLVEYQALDSLITAESHRQDRFLRALTVTGLKFTCPPRHIIDIVTKSARFRILSPEQARMALLEYTQLLQAAAKDDIVCILEYLLSTKDVLNVVDLPLIHATGGSLITLSRKETSNTATYTMLNSAEFGIFGSCDDHAISLQHLPRSIADVLRIEGPKKVNVAELTLPQTVLYLSEYPTKMGLDLSLSQISAEVKNWLSRIWIWVDTHPRKDELLEQIRPLYLLPSIAGLRKADTPLFISVGEHPKATEPLKLLGVPFLVPSLDERMQRILRSSGLLKSISDILALLNSLPDSTALSSVPNIPPDQCAFVLRRIANHLSGSLTKEQASRLRSLPLYPVVKQDTTAPISSPKLACDWMSLPEASSVYSVYEPPFLPMIDGTVFVQLNKVAPEMVRHLANASSLSDAALLEMAIDNLVEQNPYFQVIALRHISQHQTDVAPRLLEKLRHTPFVIAKDGAARKPFELFAAEAPVSHLYLNDPSRQMAAVTDLEQRMAQYLTSLRLLQEKLTLEIAHEAISKIALQPLLPESVSLSRTLMSVMNTSDLDFNDLLITSETAWLPTNRGLRAAGECRDKSHPPELFNRVFAVIEDDVAVPPSLVKAVKWDQPVPVHILIRQLGLVVEELGNQLEIVLIVLNELGRRELTDGDIESLEAVTGGNRHWVPTVDRQLSRTVDAVFLPPTNGSGFTQIYPVDYKTKVLLQRLGCADSPSFDEIASKLEQLSREDPSPQVVLIALSLLRSVRPELNQETRDRLLVPNTLNKLSPHADTFYNDIGNRSDLIPMKDKFMAHPQVDEELSRTLGLRRLGLEYAGLTTVHIDMGETPVVTVRNALKQYTDKPFATEFLANASDAGATSFSLLCNNFVPQASGGGFLSPTMAKFCSCPSLVVHNDATFKDKDFEGICRTGVGGKQQEQDKIGRFGLGALTMFSYTELAVIVSGDRVAFLNPSKFHLPLHDRATVILPLQHIRDFYPGQLQAIDGLFGFSIKSDQPYYGSIFYLPLRENSHLEGLSDPVSTRQCLPQAIEKMIRRFQELAPSCLFFTQLGLIQGINRDFLGNQHTLWKYTASREPVEVESASRYSAATIGIRSATEETESWLIVRTDIADIDVREDCRMVSSKRHAAGLALSTDNGYPSMKKSFNFFSTLPLPLSTTLPLHIMGSFALASDRREIRLDKYGGSETMYNQWLLNDVIPSLYLFLLERLLEANVDNSRWWPELHSDSDEKSRLIIESFYANHLRDSLRRVIRSSYDESRHLIPQEVVLCGDEPDSIKTVLSALESPHVASLPSRARQSAIGGSHLRVVDPAFLRDEIMKDPTTIHSLDINIINSIVRYLSPIAEDPTFLLGLHILPLADSSFAEFEEREHASDNFYVWRPMRRDSKLNLSTRHFVHHELKTSDLLKMNINICALGVEAMERLIAEECRKFSLYDSNGTSDWIFDFWQSWPEYHRLGLNEEHIWDFPFVPTILGTTFVSLRQCKEGPVVLIDKSTEEAESLRACLSRLGLHVVRPDSEPTPHCLIEILRGNAFTLLTFDRLLHALAELPDLPSLYQDIENLDEDLQNVFASWARERIMNTSDYSEPLLNVARQLPIWPSLGGTAPPMLRRASELHMLPRGIGIEAAGRFMNVPVGEYGTLHHLRGPCLEHNQIEQYLEIPPVLQPEELIAYKSFLSTWLPMIQPPHTPTIHVPDDRCHVVSTDRLYARDPLYRQAFEDDAGMFVHLSFADLEPALARHGLNTESDMNMSIFRVCAEALNNRQANDLVARAETLFDAYSFHLPVRVAHNEREIWSELDDISFIPRRMSTSRRQPGEDLDDQGDLNIPEEITSLPEVVSPMELVREEFESIAWSQRATFRKQPDRRVLNAHGSLGKPSILQVVMHLVYLSKSGALTVAQRSTFIHDLKETYAYLSKNLSSTHDIDALAQITDAKVFLNADSDDPSSLSTDWRWESADSLVFEIAETEEAYARPVRRFLLPYERLLQLAGVLRVYYSRYVGPTASHSEITKLRSIRSEFNRMRQERILIDVVFIIEQDETSDQEAPPNELVAHRSFLAASGGNFADQFKPVFREGMAASSADPVRVPMVEHSRACVERVLDFIYTGEHTVAQEASIEDLLDTLRLSGYWDIKDLFLDVQKVIIERRLVTPLTLDKVRELAILTGAQTLLTSCDDFETRNTEFILRYRRAMEENV